MLVKRVAPLLARVHELRLPDAALDIHDLLARARREALLEDFGPGDFRPGLDLLVDSINADVQPHAAGAQLLRELLGAQLRNRVGVRDWAKKNPDARAEPIRAPIVICGLPGSGVDLMAGLLGHDSAVRVVRIGEALVSAPPGGAMPVSYRPDPRAAGVADLNRRIAGAVETARVANGATTPPRQLPMPDLPASGDVVLAGHFAAPLWASIIGATSYVDWVASADVTPAYRWQQRVLQVLQACEPTQQWILHGSVHVAQIEALLAVHPDARIVWVHRDPVATARAEQRMHHQATELLTGSRSQRPLPIDSHLDQIAQAELAMSAAGVDAMALHHVELRDDPVGAIDRVYQHFDLHLATAARWRMDAWLLRRGASDAAAAQSEQGGEQGRVDPLDERAPGRREEYLRRNEVFCEFPKTP